MARSFMISADERTGYHHHHVMMNNSMNSSMKWARLSWLELRDVIKMFMLFLRSIAVVGMFVCLFVLELKELARQQKRTLGRYKHVP